MNQKEVIEKATNKVGSIGKLADKLSWDKGSIAAIKAGKKPMPAYRAAQLAEIIGEDAETTYLTTLREQAGTEFERKLLGKLLKGFKASAASLTIAALAVAIGSQAPKLDITNNSERSLAKIHYA